jgi:hypothetical protein
LSSPPIPFSAVVESRQILWSGSRATIGADRRHKTANILGTDGEFAESKRLEYGNQ